MSPDLAARERERKTMSTASAIHRGKRRHKALWHSLLVGCVASLASAVAAQDNADTFPTPSAAEEVKPHRERVAAAVLLVKSDWSKIPDADLVRAELETFLAGSELPKSYRANLLRAAPQILFAANYVSLYDRAELPGLLIWLREHNLVRDAEATSREPSNDSDPPGYQKASAVVADDVFPWLDRSGTDEPPAFAKRTYVTAWEFESRFAAGSRETLQVSTNMIPEMRDEWQTDNEPRIYPLRSRMEIIFNLPVDRIAFLNMLAFRPSREADLIRAQGWEPIWMIVPDTRPLTISGKPKLAKPSSLTQVAARKYVRQINQAEVTEPPPDSEGPPKIIKVFQLRHAEAQTAGDVLKQLVTDASFAVDERTNSIIASGPEPPLAAAEALLLRLDQPPTTGGTKPKSASDAGDSAEAADQAQLEQLTNQLRQRSASTEVQATQFAWRLPKDSGADKDPEARQQLTQLVSEAFKLRQQLQETELKLLRERMRVIETQLERRAKLQDAIIKRRVDQLLSGSPSGQDPVARRPEPGDDGKRLTLRFRNAPWNEALQWLADATDASVDWRETPSGTLTYEDPRRLDAQQAWSVIAGLLPDGWSVQEQDGVRTIRRNVRTASNSFATPPIIKTLRSPDELGLAATEVKKAIATAVDYRDSETRLREANLRLALLREEYAAQIRIIEAEVKSDELAYTIADRELSNFRRLVEKKFASESELDAAQLKRERARGKHAQSEALLELYKQVAKTTRLLDDDAPEAPASLLAHDPAEAIVWIEAIASRVAVGRDEPKRLATYFNGVVVSADGLIAVALDRSLHKAVTEASDGNDRDRLTISAFFTDRKRLDARVAAFDASTGVALLKIEVSGLRHLACGSTVGINQQVRYHSVDALGKRASGYDTQVAGIPGSPKDVPVGSFEISAHRAGGLPGIVVANDGTLVGLGAPEGSNPLLCLDADSVQQLLAARDARQQKETGGSRESSVQIEALPDLDTIIIRGPAGAVQDVVKVLSEIDKNSKDEAPKEEEKAKEQPNR